MFQKIQMFQVGMFHGCFREVKKTELEKVEFVESAEELEFECCFSSA